MNAPILIKIVKSFDLNMPQWSPKVWDKTKYIKKKKKLISNQLDKTYRARQVCASALLETRQLLVHRWAEVCLVVGIWTW